MFVKISDYVQKRVKTSIGVGPLSCLYLAMLFCLLPLIILAFITKFQMPKSDIFIIYIDTQDDALYTVNEKFLSLGLDSSLITENFINFNTSDPKLIKMIHHLSPAYLRIGGNQADEIVFSIDSTRNKSDSKFILKASSWLELYNLAQKANINIIYDLNSLQRYENGSWNSDNALEMLQFSQDNLLNVDWELGNEPNDYLHKFNASVNATQLAEDFKYLRNLLDNFPSYENSSLIGPSTTRLRNSQISDYFKTFLENGFEALSAVTFHHYYFSGVNATKEEFLDPTNFDYLEYCIDAVRSVMDLIPGFNKPIWIGETSTAWHSGAPNMSDRFLASFLWIDKLGLSAKMGVDLLIRQSLFKGNYALIDDSYYPNPDWWLSVLYKKLVGKKVLTTETEGDPNIRLYAHCANSNDLWQNTSSVVVFGVNLNNDTGIVAIEELRSHEWFFAYELKSEKDLFSQLVQLNGNTLKLDKHFNLPDFVPIKKLKDDIMEIQPYSIVFWVFTNTNVEICSL